MGTRARPPTLAAAGEFGFLNRLLPRLRGGAGVIIGPGDDCALLAVNGRRWLVTTDSLVEGVHFRQSWMTPRQIGRKAYLVNASDIAAMGGQPRFCLVSIAAPPSYPIRALMDIHRGLEAAAYVTGARVVGGNLTRARELLVSITLIGAAPPRPLRRRGARPGDVLLVTGRLGAAAAGLRQLKRNPRAHGPAVRRFREPPSRVAAGAALARAGIVTAAIDVSDGLLQDLGHLCRASRVGARVDLDRVPCAPVGSRHDTTLALHGGEDYELLCTVSPHRLGGIDHLRSRLGCELTQIGEVMPQHYRIRVVDMVGRIIDPGPGGFDHFARGSA